MDHKEEWDEIIIDSKAQILMSLRKIQEFDADDDTKIQYLTNYLSIISSFSGICLIDMWSRFGFPEDDLAKMIAAHSEKESKKVLEFMEMIDFVKEFIKHGESG